MEPEAYLKDPCRASSLPFWKTVQTEIPPHITVVRDEEMTEKTYVRTDEPFFKMIHFFKPVPDTALPDGFVLTGVEPEELEEHIRKCYETERVTADELHTLTGTAVYDAELWIAVRDRTTGQIAASGIGALDACIGEGALDWIQVSPAYRRRGLGAFVVCELLRRMQKKAAFATVSGRINNPTHPIELYRSCGFTDPVIWHVITKTPQEKEK